MWEKINMNDLESFTRSAPNKTNYEMFRKFIEENNIVSYKEDIGFCKDFKSFFKYGRSVGKNYVIIRNELRYLADHYSFYKTKDGKVIFTTQPYCYTKDEAIKRKNGLEEKFGENFNVEVFENGSWYFPGETVLFVVSLKD